MPSERATIFVSHKVDRHRYAAERIKAILQSRAERLDVHICEDLRGGDKWPQWVWKKLAASNLLLVLVPPGEADLTWIAREIRYFQAHSRGRTVVLHDSTDSPNIVRRLRREIQTVDASRERLCKLFLEPLYNDGAFLGIDDALNDRVEDLEIMRDAGEIEDVFRYRNELVQVPYLESLTIETAQVDLQAPGGLDAARIRASKGFGELLNWTPLAFTWRELRSQAGEEPGKGTFWISELEQVIGEVAVQRLEQPRVMSSTFRGRGQTAGRIFRPLLDRVEMAGDRPVRFHFVFHETLVPEIVRGKDEIGEVFNLLRLATRVRWEVLNPFLARDLTDDIADQVRRSLNVIETETERHRMLEISENTFEGKDRELVAELLRRRESVRKALEDAAVRKDFAQFREELTGALEVNCDATELLASRFLELARQDRARTRRRIETLRASAAAAS